MISAFDIGINLNVALGGLERIQQLAAEFTKLQSMATSVAQEMERMGGVLGNTFGSATTASTSFEDALERNLTTLRAMRSEASAMRESMVGMGAMGGGPRRPRSEGGGEGFGGGFIPFTARMVGGLAAIEVAQRGFEQMRTFDARISALRQSGYSQRQIDSLIQTADQARVPGMNLRDRTFLGQEVGSILGREQVTPDVIRTLGTVAKSVSDLTQHGTPQENLRYVTRSGYLLGGIDDPRKGGLSNAFLNRNVMAVQNMIAASGGATNAEEYYHNLQTASPAIRGTDFATNTDKQAIFALFSDQMKKNAGHAYKELDLSIRSGTLLSNPRTRGILQEAGMVQMIMRPVVDRETGRMSNIRTEQLRQGQTQGIALAPAIFEAVRNDLRRRGQASDDMHVINLLKAAGVNATALQGFTALGGPTGRDELERIKEQFTSMPRSADQLAASMTDLNTALQDVRSAFDDMVAKTGVLGPLSRDLSAALGRVAEAMRAIGNFAQTDIGRHFVSAGTHILELVGGLLLLRTVIGGLVRTLRFATSVPGVPRLAPVPGSFAAGAAGAAAGSANAGAGALAGGLLARTGTGFSGMMSRGLAAAFIAPMLEQLNEAFSPAALQNEISTAISAGTIGAIVGKIPGMVAGAVIGAMLEALKREENAASIMEVIQNFLSDYKNGLANLFKSPADRMNVEKMRPQNPENYGDPTNESRVPRTTISKEVEVTAPRIRDTVPRPPIPRPTPMGPTGAGLASPLGGPGRMAGMPQSIFNMDLTHPFGPPRPIGSGPLTTAPVVPQHPQISPQVPRINTSNMAVTTMHVGSMTGPGAPAQGGAPLAPANPVPTVPPSPTTAPVRAEPLAPPNPAPAAPAALAANRMPVSQALPLIRRFESGGGTNPEGANVPNYRFDATHTAGGYYQITNTTWREMTQKLGITGYPTAMSAPRDVQDQVATRLYQERGFTPWQVNNRLMAAVGGVQHANPNAVTQNQQLAQNDPSIQIPRQPTSYHSQVDVHLDDEVIASHMFNHIFDFNPSGNAGITGYDTNMSPWSPGTNIPR